MHRIAPLPSGARKGSGREEPECWSNGAVGFESGRVLLTGIVRFAGQPSVLECGDLSPLSSGATRRAVPRNLQLATQLSRHAHPNTRCSHHLSAPQSRHASTRTELPSASVYVVLRPSTFYLTHSRINPRPIQNQTPPAPAPRWGERRQPPLTVRCLIATNVGVGCSPTRLFDY